jgi:hypothetical protein
VGAGGGHHPQATQRYVPDLMEEECDRRAAAMMQEFKRLIAEKVRLK